MMTAFDNSKENQTTNAQKRTVRKKNHLEHWHVVTALLIVYDYVAVLASFFLALWIRFDCRFQQIPTEYWSIYLQSIFIYGLFCVIIFLITYLYRSIWRFASYRELLRTLIATFFSVAVYLIAMLSLQKRMPVSYYIFGFGFQFVLILGVRFSYRFILLYRSAVKEKSNAKKKVMIIGAGQAGQTIFRDIRIAKEIEEHVTCFIDDNPNKWGRYIDNVQVYGGRDSIFEAVEKFGVEKIYVAIPTATPQQKRDILTICNETNCELKSLPGIYQLANGELSVSKMKEVAIEDLLGRDPIKVNSDELLNYIQDKVILVTGGGGSIGSELCRQIAAHNPKHLIIFDVYENNAYAIQLELKRKYPYLKLDVIIGSVRDSRKIFQVFETYRPQIVYHAAAHKHVPLMEDSPCEAIKNNALGTYKTAYAAMVHGCERFVLISTDKAVNPTNVMGASKRLCEKINICFDTKIKEEKAYEIPQLFTHGMNEVVTSTEVQEGLRNAKTKFVAVRFGNVLGSNGSVIPIFKQQIENGGPVTVTHPDIIRYFMTIPEAVGLVLQAGINANGGEIFVLDMGEPVKIDTLARNMIRLSGYKPDEEIKITYTGLRPGEKLYEEKLMAEEGLLKTENDLIHIGKPVAIDVDKFLGQLDGLMEAAYKNVDNIRELLQEVVETYYPM